MATSASGFDNSPGTPPAEAGRSKTNSRCALQGCFLRRWALGLIAALVLFSLYASHRLVLLGRTVESELAQIRAAGYPTTAAELDKMCSQEGWEGAFIAALSLVQRPTQEQSAELYAKVPIANGALGAGGEPLCTATRESIEAYLEANAQALRALKGAATLPPSAYPVTIEASLFSSVHVAAKILQLSALLNADRGDAANAIEAVTVLLALGRSLEEGPCLTFSRVGNVICCLGTNALQDTLERLLGSLTEQDFERLQDELILHDDPERFRRILIGERAIMIDSFLSGRFPFGIYDPLVDPVHEVARFLYVASGSRDIDLLRFLDLSAASIEAVEAPLSERLTRWRALSAKESYWKDLANRDLEHHARVRTAVAAVGVQRSRMVLGRLLVSPAELLPQAPPWPNDPFDGQPLRYHRVDGGYKVYSVGQDGVDDAGTHDDIVFIIRG
jgi:hypothetical protein